MRNVLPLLFLGAQRRDEHSTKWAQDTGGIRCTGRARCKWRESGINREPLDITQIKISLTQTSLNVKMRERIRAKLNVPPHRTVRWKADQVYDAATLKKTLDLLVWSF
ncbi:hypothetical protein A6U88_14075 [Agrobacterium sp. B131/95]|nr:hypothetical protein A6U88_14075 [Agrobacterium sp. B131/95]